MDIHAGLAGDARATSHRRRQQDRLPDRLWRRRPRLRYLDLRGRAPAHRALPYGARGHELPLQLGRSGSGARRQILIDSPKVVDGKPGLRRAFCVSSCVLAGPCLPVPLATAAKVEENCCPYATVLRKSTRALAKSAENIVSALDNAWVLSSNCNSFKGACASSLRKGRNATVPRARRVRDEGFSFLREIFG
jgi:hypothetical protein